MSVLVCESDPVRDFADRIALSLGTQARHEHGASLALCPVHETTGRAHRPSLAVFRGKHGRIVAHCRAGCPSLAVRQALASLGIAGPRPESFAEVASHMRDEKDRREAQLVEAKELWERSSAVQPHSALARYLASRGLRTDLLGPAIRETDDLRWPRRLMLGAIVDLASLERPTIRAVGLTTLAINDGGEAVVQNGRKLRLGLGDHSGHGVPLGSALDGEGRLCHRVVVGEGIESVMSFMAMKSEPFGVACLGTRGLENVRLPRWVRDVVIASDHDDAGQAAAQKLAQRLLGSGIAASIRRPKTSGLDFNDVLQKHHVFAPQAELRAARQAEDIR